MANEIDWKGKTRITRSEWIFIGFLTLFCALFTFVELNNGRLWTNDFRVYFEATRDFFAGHNPYRHNYGLDTGYFKYPPFTLYIFSFQAVLPYGAGQAIHLALLAFALIYSVLQIRRLTGRFAVAGPRILHGGMLYLLFACIAIHLTRELHLGNINLILLLLLILGLRSLLNGKDLPAVIWLSLMLILKPIMLPALLPLLLLRKWRIIGFMGVLGAFFFLFPIVHVGWNANLILWTDWFKAISAHGEYLTSFNSLSTLIKVHTGFVHGWVVALFVFAGLSGLMVYDLIRRKRSVEKMLIVWIAVFTAFIPNLFVTDTEHFLLSIPLIWLLLSAIRNNGKWFHWAIFAIGMLCFSFNSTDLLGSELSNVIYNNGFLGIGNLIFLGLFLWLHFRKGEVAVQ